MMEFNVARLNIFSPYYVSQDIDGQVTQNCVIQYWLLLKNSFFQTRAFCYTFAKQATGCRNFVFVYFFDGSIHTKIVIYTTFVL